mmetsp:Transcript_3891/g.6147  ORF Transcript_3891/g.6147 Transcript_3891/m.6147 type:complete len:239 (-) Transcript_3891:54-770(-)
MRIPVQGNTPLQIPSSSSSMNKMNGVSYAWASSTGLPAPFLVIPNNKGGGGGGGGSIVQVRADNLLHVCVGHLQESEKENEEGYDGRKGGGIGRSTSRSNCDHDQSSGDGKKVQVIGRLDTDYYRVRLVDEGDSITMRNRNLPSKLEGYLGNLSDVPLDNSTAPPISAESFPNMTSHIHYTRVQLSPGSWVRMRNLEKAKDLNDRRGTIISFDPIRSRYLVRLSAKEQVRAKIECVSL